MKYLHILFTGCFLILLTGCGGGSSGANTSNIPQPLPQSLFSLAKLYSATPLGVVYSTQITATSSTGNINYTGSFSRTNQAQEMLSGVLVTPSKVTTILINGGSTTSFSNTVYIDTSGYELSSLNSEGVTCAPAILEISPLLVKVGDTGIFSTLSCSDNTSYNVSWKVEDAGDNTILYIETGAYKDQASTITANYESTYNIDTKGNIVSFKSVTTTVNSGNVFTMQSL